MHQAGQDPQQVEFHDIHLWLRDDKITVAKWNCLMSQTPNHIEDLTPVPLHYTSSQQLKLFVSSLHPSGQPIATITAVHTGANVAKAPADDAGGLESVMCLVKSVRVMLTSNFWVDIGHVDEEMATVWAICYCTRGPPDLPVYVTVRFDNYSWPILHEGTVPITPLWLPAG